jgi:hypothetical protein
MKSAIFALLAFTLANVSQVSGEIGRAAHDESRKSMLGMLSKFIELNGTIDELMKGSTTELVGRVWLNATERPSGICEVQREYTEEVTITERVPHQVEVEVWCWSGIRCTEWETHYREVQQKKNVTKTRLDIE